MWPERLPCAAYKFNLGGVLLSVACAQESLFFLVCRHKLGPVLQVGFLFHFVVLEEQFMFTLCAPVRVESKVGDVRFTAMFFNRGG